MTLESATDAELRALLRLADLAVAEAAAILGDAVGLRDRIRAALAVRDGAEVDAA